MVLGNHIHAQAHECAGNEWDENPTVGLLPFCSTVQRQLDKCACGTRIAHARATRGTQKKEITSIAQHRTTNGRPVTATNIVSHGGHSHSSKQYDNCILPGLMATHMAPPIAMTSSNGFLSSCTVAHRCSTRVCSEARIAHIIAASISNKIKTHVGLSLLVPISCLRWWFHLQINKTQPSQQLRAKL